MDTGFVKGLSQFLQLPSFLKKLSAPMVVKSDSKILISLFFYQSLVLIPQTLFELKYFVSEWCSTKSLSILFMNRYFNNVPVSNIKIEHEYEMRGLKRQSNKKLWSKMDEISLELFYIALNQFWSNH